MNQLGYGRKARRVVADLGEAALDVVLDGLDVMHRLALDLSELGNVVDAEVFDDRSQAGLLLRGEGPNTGDHVVVGQMDQPLDLDPHPLAVEGRLGEVVDQRGNSTAIAAVEGAERDGRGRVS